MLSVAGQARTQEFGFFLQPNFSMFAFTAALEPLRAANRLSGSEIYGWKLLTVDGKPVMASNGIEVMPNLRLKEAEGLRNVFVVAGADAHLYDDKRTFSWLRKMASRGCRIGALSTGTYTLAKAGLLKGYRCTVHWENLSGFREEYPNLDVSSELFEIDRNRLTCSGGTASLDLMLSLIALEHDRQLATEVAEQFMHERIRDRHDPQRMTLRNRLGISHPKLISVIELMEQNIEDPLSRQDLASRCGLSPRQLERLFRKYVGRTPIRFYQELRLQRARSLLIQTSMSILDIALACGFVSAPHFSKCYREFFGKTPRMER